jgi:hypothetical protein
MFARGGGPTPLSPIGRMGLHPNRSDTGLAMETGIENRNPAAVLFGFMWRKICASSGIESKPRKIKKPTDESVGYQAYGGDAAI